MKIEICRRTGRGHRQVGLGSGRQGIRSGSCRRRATHRRRWQRRRISRPPGRVPRRSGVSGPREGWPGPPRSSADVPHAGAADDAWPVAGADRAVGQRVAAWDGGHAFGTDLLGRDYALRLLPGGRTAIGIAAAGVALAIVAGAALGVAAAHVGSWWDEAAMRLETTLTAIPDTERPGAPSTPQGFSTAA